MKRLGIIGVTALAACATPVPVTTNPPASGSTSVSVPSSQGSQWTGSFIPANDRSAEVGMRGAVRSYGTVSVVPTAGEYSKVSLTFGGYRASTLGWALAPGRCGSSSVPVLPSNAFPLLDVGAGGNAQLTSEIRYILPTDGTFHVRIYKADGVVTNSAQGPEGIIACSNLKYQQ